MMRRFLLRWRRGADHLIAYAERGEAHGLPWWVSVIVAWLVGMPAVSDLLEWFDKRTAIE